MATKKKTVHKAPRTSSDAVRVRLEKAQATASKYLETVKALEQELEQVEEMERAIRIEDATNVFESACEEANIPVVWSEEVAKRCVELLKEHGLGNVKTAVYGDVAAKDVDAGEKPAPKKASPAAAEGSGE